MSKLLDKDAFAVGLAQLERFFRRKLHPFDRDIYYDTVKRAPAERWEKVVKYACMKAKSMPKPVELRDWMGLEEELTPAEEAHGFKAGTVRGVTPFELVERVRQGAPLPFDEDCWSSELERTIYLDQPYKNPPPEEASVNERLAWVRRYSEAAEEELEKLREFEAKQKAEAERDGV